VIRTCTTVCLSLLVAAAAARADDAVRLSLKEAEQRAVDNHPLVQAGHYATLAGGEVVRQTRSTFMPTVLASFTGATAQDGTRITAGGLNNPTILDRFAAGMSVSQLLTDFGRTSNLVSSQVLRTDALEQDEVTRRSDVLLQVDRAYFNALRARALLTVAQQTVAARQLVADQVAALAASGLKSTLDASFARVNLSQAQLLLAQAQGDVQSADASLTAALGSRQPTEYELSDEPTPSLPAGDKETAVALALRDRPDLSARRFAEQAASKFVAAERALSFPSISILGAGGFTPYHQIGLSDRYSAIGVNVTLPVTNGNLNFARHAEASYQEQIERQALRDLENQIARDVTLAWLDVQTASQRVDLAAQLVAQAGDAQELAQSRYDLGLSSIVELTQAQLNKTQADIEQTTAKYDYQSRIAALRFQMGTLK
jgi:outer membrane protein